MIIKNGQVFTQKCGFEEREVRISGSLFTDQKNPEDEQEVIDAAGCYVIPGLTDIHVHGCNNQDFCDADAEAIGNFAAYEASKGITAICPTTMTIPEKRLLKIAETAAQYCEMAEKNSAAHAKEAVFAGINMEGPFISPDKKGSQEKSDIRKPDAGFIREMLAKSGGKICLVDIAPEMEGAEELIREMKNKVTISIAHTNADYETARHAMELGVHHVTHLYNAMSAYDHRAPGVVGAASDDPQCMVELICDGVHNHPAVVRNTFRIFGADRVVLVSDSMRATGMPDGIYELGGHKVHVNGKKALLEDGTIAASVTNLMDCMKTCVQEMQIPLETAVQCAAVNPAKSIGMYDRFGSISAGKLANAVLLDCRTLEVRKVILRGIVL